MKSTTGTCTYFLHPDNRVVKYITIFFANPAGWFIVDLVKFGKKELRSCLYWLNLVAMLPLVIKGLETLAIRLAKRIKEGFLHLSAKFS